MPLLLCPNCQVGMREVERRGVVLDVCPQCGGVWLDRGELEKLLAEAKEANRAHEEKWGTYPHGEGKPYRKKKGFLEIFDLFD
ncbi:zf-TFIIB domain-containing protein [Thermus amyloliquefaciens]|uniref:TFIIB-type zinc ribbon-containing protein n=1 Tax=Thermus amyloliquefaciens TaxID=1449080 RepID=UPI000571583F|nr:zf-TFIIB domain-containing protein [Thermus amyloliquefaciens]